MGRHCIGKTANKNGTIDIQSFVIFASKMRIGENLTLRSQRNSDDILKFLQFEEGFYDVTLCTDGPPETYLKAHQLLLAASPSVFKEMLRAIKMYNPISLSTIYLKGVQHEDLAMLLDFIYQGEVNVPKERITSFISLAEGLEVKGLFRNKNKNGDASVNVPIDLKDFYSDRKRSVSRIKKES